MIKNPLQIEVKEESKHTVQQRIDVNETVESLKEGKEGVLGLANATAAFTNFESFSQSNASYDTIILLISLITGKIGSLVNIDINWGYFGDWFGWLGILTFFDVGKLFPSISDTESAQLTLIATLLLPLAIICRIVIVGNTQGKYYQWESQLNNACRTLVCVVTFLCLAIPGFLLDNSLLLGLSVLLGALPLLYLVVVGYIYDKFRDYVDNTQIENVRKRYFEEISIGIELHFLFISYTGCYTSVANSLFDKISMWDILNDAEKVMLVIGVYFYLIGPLYLIYRIIYNSSFWKNMWMYFIALIPGGGCALLACCMAFDDSDSDDFDDEFSCLKLMNLVICLRRGDEDSPSDIPSELRSLFSAFTNQCIYFKIILLLEAAVFSAVTLLLSSVGSKLIGGLCVTLVFFLFSSYKRPYNETIENVSDVIARVSVILTIVIGILIEYTSVNEYVAQIVLLAMSLLVALWFVYILKPLTIAHLLFSTIQKAFSTVQVAGYSAENIKDIPKHEVIVLAVDTSRMKALSLLQQYLFLIHHRDTLSVVVTNLNTNDLTKNISVLRFMGFNYDACKSVGGNMTDLLKAGYTTTDLITVGFPVPCDMDLMSLSHSDLKTLVVTMFHFKTTGALTTEQIVTLVVNHGQEIQLICDVENNVEVLRNLQQLSATSEFSEKDIIALRTAGYSQRDLKACGLSVSSRYPSALIMTHELMPRDDILELVTKDVISTLSVKQKAAIAVHHRPDLISICDTKNDVEIIRDCLELSSVDMASFIEAGYTKHDILKAGIHFILRTMSIVHCLCFSPDGSFICSGSADKAVRIWSAMTGELMLTMTGHTHIRGVKTVCYSPDGKYICSGCWGGSTKIWTVATGECVLTITSDAALCYYNACYSPNGQFICSIGGYSENAIKMWSAASGECIRTMTGHTRNINSACFSPDGRFICSGSQDRTVKLWSAATGKCMQTMTGHTGDVTCVCYSPDGRFVCSVAEDRRVKIWSAATGECIHNIATDARHMYQVTSVFYSPDSRFICSGSRDNTVKIWSAASGECIRTLTGHTRNVNSACYSPDGHFICSCSDDGTIRIWAGQNI